MSTIYAYQDYRSYLREFYLNAKARGTGITYASFSQTAGIRAPNFLKLVIDGKKNLTIENVVRFSRALKLKEREAEYFESLVHLNQSRKPLEQEYYRGKLDKQRAQAHDLAPSHRTLEEWEFESLSSWLHHAIMVLTNVRGFRENPTWIRQKLFNLATEEEISSVLERLTELKLLTRDPSTGRLTQSQRQIRTKPELRRLSAQIFYEGLFARAAQALRICEPDGRELSTYIVGLSPRRLPELKRKVREFMASINEWALEESAPSDVFALTFSGIPLTRSGAPARAEVLTPVTRKRGTRA